MEDNKIAQPPVEEPSPNEPAVNSTVEPSIVSAAETIQPAASSDGQERQAAPAASAAPAPKRKKAARVLIAAAAAVLILAILAGGAFFGIRLYEAQRLSQAKALLAQSNWAAAEAAAEQGISLQRSCQERGVRILNPTQIILFSLESP